MHDWLLGHGIKESRISMENQATGTPINATLSMEILYRGPNIRSYTLISGSSHLRRAEILLHPRF